MTLTKEDVHHFIRQNKLAVLSTVDDQGFPHAAPIYYITDEQYNFYFMTATQTSKHSNILSHSHVSLTIVNMEENTTLQVKGEAAECPTKITDVLQMLAEKLNQADTFPDTIPFMSFKNHEKMAIQIVPTEIKMRHYDGSHREEIIL